MKPQRARAQGPTWASVATSIALLAAALAVGLAFAPAK